MRIYDRNLTGAAGSEAERTRETQRLEGTGGGSRSSAARQDLDRVEFSQTLGRLSQALAHDQNGHAAKIQALAASFQNGTYKVDSASISKAIITEAMGGPNGDDLNPDR